MNTHTAHAAAPRAGQVFLHPAAMTDRNAIRRMQERHQIVFQIKGRRIAAVAANDLPGGGDAA